MFEDPRFHKYAMAPAMKGMVAALGASCLVGGESKLSLGGMSLPPAAVIGVSVAGASIVTELTHDMILKKISGEHASKTEAMFLAPGLTAAATIGAAWLTIGPVTDMKAAFELAALGAGAEVGGTYLHSAIMPLMLGDSSVSAHGL